MKLTFNKSQGFTVPEQLTAILNGELTNIDNAEPACFDGGGYFPGCN